MEDMKISGSLTQGSGMDEKQRNIWILSMPICAAVHQLLQEVANPMRKSGEQHAEMGEPVRKCKLTQWQQKVLLRLMGKHRTASISVIDCCS